MSMDRTEEQAASVTAPHDSVEDMRFALLGPLRAWLPGREVDLGSPQQRAVLAAMLLRQGRPIAVEQLVDAIWGDSPSPGAVSTVRTYVSRLRRVLEPDRESGRRARVVVSVAGGYALSHRQGTVDMEEFEARAADGRRLDDAGLPHDAAEALTSALDIWQGPALGGVPGPLADAERMRLEERRMSVLEAKLDLGLRLGRHDDAVAELTALCAAHPLRERLWALLILGLYRCGRRADALRAYREARKVLVAELGVEPGRELQDLHAGVLTGNLPSAGSEAPARPADTSLRAATAPIARGQSSTKDDGTPGTTPSGGQPFPSADAASAVPPRQLPDRLATFVGRKDEIAEAMSLVPAPGEPSAVIAISGTAGVGKTAAAVHLAHAVAGRFPEGQLYLNLRGFDPSGGAVQPAAAIQAILTAVGHERQIPRDPDAQMDLYRSVLAQRPLLILLDNARDSDHVRPLLPSTSGCLVLVTSRDPLAGLVTTHSAFPIALGALEEDEAVAFLAERIGRARASAEPRAVRDIVNACARLPLALAIVASHAATHPASSLSRVATELRLARGDLDAFQTSDSPVDPRPADAPARRDTPRGPVALHSLPRAIDDFVGRRAELLRLTELADDAAGRTASDSAVVAAVYGPPGAGKTALAVHAVRRLADRFPDGQIVLDLRGTDENPPQTAELMLRALKALGCSDHDLAGTGPRDRPGLYQEMVAHRRCLLVLDNAHDEAQVRPLLPHAGPGMALITSRRMLTGLSNVHRLPLAQLSAEDAIAFLAALAGAERAAADPEALADIARRCDYLPLALRVAGNWLVTRTGWSVRRLADRLAQEERRLDALTAGDVHVAAAFDLSYRRLSPGAARMFRLLALVEGPDIGAACAARLIGQALFDAEDTMEELVESGLLNTERDRYRLHDLLKLFARTRLVKEESAEQITQARTSMNDWLLETAIVAGRWYEPDHGAPPADWQGTVDLSTPDKARKWLRAEGLNWLAALRAAARTGQHARVVEVAEALHWFSDQWIFWGHWHEVFRTAAEAAGALNDPLLEATQLNYHAWALLVCEGRPLDSLPRATNALACARRAGDAAQQAWAHLYLALAHRRLRDMASAERHNREAIHLFEAAGDLHGALQALHVSGQLQLDDGRPRDAVVAYRRTLTFLDQHAHELAPHIAAFSRTNLHGSVGVAHLALDDAEQALEHLETAVGLSRAMNNPGLESRHLVHLAQALEEVGRAAEAHAVYTRILSLGGDGGRDAVTTARAWLAARRT
ncbi:BTAD domain-containing putative transcriptional regulator [Streptomyces sp. AK02-01A]|uniref:BTAD domain-containing putative transcriptional regulator n=1 Tax=Streptomyces sp. AK02-01A TaxID=3028648 RepID=UPI0029BC74F0|nr:BTAD domain-containing putative transcriptional regulator [Streptomyces sp. AK02-01A]MDX3850971.1 BTAD domain-containing putative transcriptional regulator [Streptomyces sp. AK02-01A]